jgi:hypothetical protein
MSFFVEILELAVIQVIRINFGIGVSSYDFLLLRKFSETVILLM